MESIPCIDDRRRSIFLFLLSFFPEESLIVLKVLQRRFDPGVYFVLQLFDDFTMESHILSSATIPLSQHLVIGFFLLETHLYQHPHLFKFKIIFHLTSSSSHSFIKIRFLFFDGFPKGLFLLWVLSQKFLFEFLHVILKLFVVSSIGIGLGTRPRRLLC